MEININRGIKEELALSKIKLRLNYKNSTKRILILFAIGATVSLFNVINYNVINLCIGMLFIGGALMLYYETYIGISNPLNLSKTEIENYKVNIESISIKIDDSFIVYETLKSCIRMKWSAIKNYKLYENNLFILPGKEYKTSFVIKKSELSEVEFTELCSFLSQNYKKI
jgi:hypothetical protein